MSRHPRFVTRPGSFAGLTIDRQPRSIFHLPVRPFPAPGDLTTSAIAVDTNCQTMINATVHWPSQTGNYCGQWRYDGS
jgi:hypothetical protein